MYNKAHALFISDLHLESTAPRTVESFLRFLHEVVIQAEALYILGDLFEAWVGDDNDKVLNGEVTAALARVVERGIPVYFMRGNRDFLIGKQFLAASKAILLEDPVCINLYGKRVLLTHGDVLCTSDPKHQTYRKWVTSPWVQRLILALPLQIRQMAARWLRKQSQRHHKKLSWSQMDVVAETVERYMKDYQADMLIHGHTHRPKIHTELLNGAMKIRIVLGAWHEEVSVFRYENTHQMALASYPLAPRGSFK